MAFGPPTRCNTRRPRTPPTADGPVPIGIGLLRFRARTSNGHAVFGLLRVLRGGEIPFWTRKQPPWSRRGFSRPAAPTTVNLVGWVCGGKETLPSGPWPLLLASGRGSFLSAATAPSAARTRILRRSRVTQRWPRCSAEWREPSVATTASGSTQGGGCARDRRMPSRRLRDRRTPERPSTGSLHDRSPSPHANRQSARAEKTPLPDRGGCLSRPEGEFFLPGHLSDLVVRRFLRDGEIVGMRLAKPRLGDSNESRLRA